MNIDADLHFWKYNKTLQAPLIRSEKKMQEDMLPSAVQLNLKRNNIDGCVAVAAEPTEVETRFLSELMRTNPLIRGVVGWVNPDATATAQKMEELAVYPEIRGYRISATGFFPGLTGEVMNVLAMHQYSLDLDLSTGAEISKLKTWIDAWPEQVFILSHGGNPNAAASPSEGWISAVKMLASSPNVYCKISGFFTLAAWNKWRPGDFYPFLETLFSSFGSNRLLYGSDWPFLLLSGSYVQWKSLLEKFTGHLDEDARNDFFGGNAQRIYRL